MNRAVTAFRPWAVGCMAAGALFLAGCDATKMKMGDADAKTTATGSAAGSATDNASGELEHCQTPLGTVSLVENQQAGWYTILRNEYRLPPTANLLRLLVQQSNCFVVVERSAAGMDALGREREMAQSGEMRGGSNFGRGQMVAADYALSPEIVFSNRNAGGGVGGFGGGIGSLIGIVAGSMNTKEASTMLTLVDNRSGVQVAASEGSASKTDFGALGGLFTGGAGGGAGGYTNTAEGKVIAAAFMDAYNQMVKALRQYKAQSVQGQGLGGGGRLGVDGGAAPSATSAQPMDMRTAQQKLNDLGYSVGGAPDGAGGPKTAAAIKAFQKDNGLPQNGRLDAATRQALSIAR